MRIAICDDEIYFAGKLREILMQYLEERHIDFEIELFSSGREFVELGVEMLQYQIIFLDINMKQMDGIETAKNVRAYTEESFVVFVTAYIDYSLEGYQVGASRYILKNNLNFREQIYECMDAITKKMKCFLTRKIFRFQEGEKKIRIENILYIESKLHKLEFNILEHGLATYTMYGTLNELENELEEYPFLRIHQSFLVNLKYIKCVTGYKVVLSNGQELTVPRARYKTVKDTFIAYKGEL
ncbi:MAG: LytR/AlgR family response regulator transcription factor [Roseburia sp.]